MRTAQTLARTPCPDASGPGEPLLPAAGKAGHQRGDQAYRAMVAAGGVASLRRSGFVGTLSGLGFSPALTDLAPALSCFLPGPFYAGEAGPFGPAWIRIACGQRSEGRPL